jgi:predicted membrane channel-forming protein YqfA (hemolysin III family)
MQGILYEEHSAWLFVLVTVVLGGMAAWQMGRSIAQTWRPFLVMPVYVALLTCGVRFLHFALFQGTLLSVQYFIVDFVVLFLAAALGWRMQRAEQMRTQYSFAFTGAGPVSWRRKVS